MVEIKPIRISNNKLKQNLNPRKIQIRNTVTLGSLVKVKEKSRTRIKITVVQVFLLKRTQSQKCSQTLRQNHKQISKN